MISEISILQGDITQQHVDAIINAANETLLGGGGVDGAIHRAAGPELLAECRTLRGCKTGDAKITKGHKLLAKWIIHTVGPVWRGGNNDEDELLASAYRRSLEVAVEAGVKTVAFPSISTGAYNFPLYRAAPIAIKTIHGFIQTNPVFDEVRLVCFDKTTFEAYQKALSSI